MRALFVLPALGALAFLVFDQEPVNASGGRLLPEQAAFDVQHYTLRLLVDPDVRAIAGSLTMAADATASLDSVVLDLDHRFSVKAVSQGSRALEFEHTEGRVHAALDPPVAEGESFEVRVNYGGEPRVAPNPPWDGGFTWETTRDGRPWIATSCQGEGADLWWPCKDHPSDKAEGMDLHITVPDGLVVASNGVLQSEKVTEVGEGDARGTPAKWRTFHWKVHNPIANYAVALNIAPYEIVETTFHSVGGEAVPVAFYALPEDEVRARRRLPEFLDHLRFFEELLGPYPFRNEKYGVAQTPHLGMEHQTIIAYGYDFQHDAYGYDWLHHHEASHEWWANLVTCRDWKDMWLHEGFGTYMQFLYVERMHGAEGMQRHMSERRREIHNARPVAPELSADSKGIYFGNTEERDNDIYYKGAWVLHTLRYLIGDEAFFASLRRFAYPTAEMEKVTDGSQVRFADTNDYRKLVEQTTVRDLGWFFDVYLHQPKLPKLQYRRDREGVQLTWTVPEGHEFEMPVPVRIDGEIQRIAMPGGKGQFDLAEGKRIEIDPEHWILRD